MLKGFHSRLFVLCLVVFSFGFIGNAEVKSLKFRYDIAKEDFLTAYYDDRNQEYWTKDKMAEVGSRPAIYFEEYDYILGVMTEGYFHKKYDARLIEVLEPILKKYKYVVIYSEYVDSYVSEYFLIEEDKYVSKHWLMKEITN